MSEDELHESRGLTIIIADLERKLTYWRHERSVAEQVVEKITERMGVLAMRQKALMEGRAARGARA